MTTDQLTEDRFLRDVATHEMIVLHDNGLHRHIRFKKPDTGNMYFDLITWPGHLCYSGGMGTYVFQRTSDMFDFFVERKYLRANTRTDRCLSINLSYWTEKLIAVDGNRYAGTAMEFSKEKFKQTINEYRVRWMREAKEHGHLDKEGRRDLWEAVEDDVLSKLDDDEDGILVQKAAHDFSHKVRGVWPWQFDDLFEINFKDYTYHVIWCCYALAWGIQRYYLTCDHAEALEMNAGLVVAVTS